MTKQPIELGSMRITFLVEGADSNGSVAIFELRVDANAALPAPHSHDGYEETLYGLDGSSTWEVDGTPIEVGPGDALCIRRGSVHAFRNPGSVEARVLCVVTPGILGPDYFLEIRQVVADAHGGPPDLARMGEVMRRHGLTPAPRPGS
jgi:quercetin dioxygenase-like cupin family protein